MYPGQIVAAGRSYEKAEQFSQQTKGRVRPYKLDVSQPLHSDWMDETKLVIMCLDQEATSFAETVLRAGIDYIDISAKGAYMEQMAQIDQQAAQCNGFARCRSRARPYEFISCESGI
ncbi:saccharopine dehydrogenase NADP-binding domain-containing protein [Bacillus safensis]|uniref:saccharopine dehydrogenase NADP-binding domain-containing protein n=1 Tax=Bacillus safensis TaxID=561879 RepID=UPI003810E4BD